MLTKNTILTVIVFSVILTVIVWAGYVYCGEVLPSEVDENVILGSGGVQLGIINQLPEGAEWIDQDNVLLENGSVVAVVDLFPEYFQEVEVENAT